MQWLAEICVRRPVFATVLILLIGVIGLFGYAQLGVDRFPKVDLPIVTITTTLAGAAPEDVETEITDKVEEAVNTISSIDEIRSVSSEGVSQVFITFLLEKDVDVASQEVRDKLSTVIPDLPKDVDQPIVSKVDPDAAPIVYVALSSKHPIIEATEYADKKVRRQIETVPGVGQVKILGGRKRQVNVWLDPIKLRGAGVTVTDVQKAIDNQNLTTPGGSVDTGPEQLTLRVRGRVTRAGDIGGLVVKNEAQHSIRVSDLGRVEDGAEEQDSIARRNGEPTIFLAIRKQSGANTVEVADEIKEKLVDMRATLPDGYRLDLVRDDSAVIRTSVDAVKEHLVLGALFAALVVLVFLGSLRSTIIAAVAIPVSIVGTFALMWIEKFTLNTITLLALALAVGIVIDDAIVVLENIYRHVEEKGMHPFAAAISGTKEIGLAVLATTLSLIAVFLPIAFMAGIPGRFLKSFGVTMAFSIGVSLIVSFSLTPMMAARFLKPAPGPGVHTRKSWLERGVDVIYRPIERVYMTILGFVMKQRWIVVIACGLTLGSCVPLVKIAPKGFLPRADEAQFQVTVRAPEGASLWSTDITAERIARKIRAINGVETTLLTIGEDDQKTQNLGTIYVKLTDPATRTESQDDLENRVRNEVVKGEDKSLRVTVGDVAVISGGGTTSARVNYTISGPDLALLTKASDDITAKLRAVPGAVDVDTSLIVGKPEVGVYVDRAKAADLGVQVVDVADALRLLVAGQQVSTYEEKGEQYEVHVRAERQYRADEQGLRLITVPSKRLGFVPLSDVVTLKNGTGPAQINRYNRQRQVTILANPAPGVGDSTISDKLA